MFILNTGAANPVQNTDPPAPNEPIGIHEKVASQLYNTTQPTPTKTAAPAAPTPAPVTPPAGATGMVPISKEEHDKLLKANDALQKLATYTQQLEYAYAQELNKLQGKPIGTPTTPPADGSTPSPVGDDDLLTLKTGEKYVKNWMREVLIESSAQDAEANEKSNIESAIPEYYTMQERPEIIVPRVRFLAEQIRETAKQQGRIVPWNYAYAEAMKGYGVFKQPSATSTQNANAPTGQGQAGAPIPAANSTQPPQVAGMQGTPDSTSQVPPQNTGQTPLQLKEQEVSRLKEIAEKPTASELDIRRWMQAKQEVRQLYRANK